MANPNDRLAVLIDADNVSPTHIGAVLAEVTKYGVASVKRIYGDWTSESLRGWKEAANRNVIQPIQQFAYTTGKNSTDSALIIDAMDLLYTERFDGFCIVSSDSDFTRLASRLRESGVTVHGFGERKTPEAFRNACDTFTYFDVIAEPSEIAEPVAAKRVPPAKLKGDAKLVNLLRASVDAASDDDGWANLGGVGSIVRKQSPDFDSRNWGYAKLSDLATAIGLFDTEKTPAGIRLKNKTRK